MQKFYDFIENDFNEQVLINEKEFIKTALESKLGINNKNVKDLKFKIKSHIKKSPQLSNYDVDDLINKAIDCIIVRSLFLKSVTRQGKSEKLQKKFIEETTNGEIILKILPKSGDNSYRINHDGYIEKGIKKNKLKSLDTKITYKGNDYFGIHKLTHNYGCGDYTSGGGQDNQQNDAILNGVDVYHDKHLLIVVLDGSYYHKPLKNGHTKIHLLKMENKNKQVIITDSLHIMEDIDKYLNNNNING